MPSSFIEIDLTLSLHVSFDAVQAEPSVGLMHPTIDNLVILDHNGKPIPTEAYSIFTAQQMDKIYAEASARFYEELL